MSARCGDCLGSPAERPRSGILWAKTLSWAVVHVLITCIVVLMLTGDPAMAMTIGLMEPMLQTLAYALHERIWLQRAGHDLRGRALTLKTFSYFLVHMGVATTLVWAVTGDLRAALTLGLLEPLVQTVAFGAHERAWGWWSRRDRAPAVAQQIDTV